MAFHTLSQAVALYYLNVTKATRARTAQVQSRFLQGGPAAFHVRALRQYSKHHQSSFRINCTAVCPCHWIKTKQKQNVCRPPARSEIHRDINWQMRRCGVPKGPSLKSSHTADTHTRTITSARCFVFNHAFHPLSPSFLCLFLSEEAAPRCSLSCTL